MSYVQEDKETQKAAWRDRARRGEKVRSSPPPDVPLPQDAQDLLDTLSPDDAADFIRTALEQPAVRKAFLDRYVKVQPGVNIGERGEVALYLSRYYNGPAACLMAITRQDPQTGEWQLLVGERANGMKTIPGGHFAPFTAEECWDYFYRQGIAPEVLRKQFHMLPPPNDHVTDEKTQDVDLFNTVQKETVQESNIFLMPQGLSRAESQQLNDAVRKAFPDVSVSSDYEISSSPLVMSEVGFAGKNWHSLLFGFGVRLQDQQALNAPIAGDDLAKVTWVPLSKLSVQSTQEAKDAGTFKDGVTYIGDMKYGEKPVVLRALAEMERETPEVIVARDGHRLGLAYTIAEIEDKVTQIAGDFGLEREHVLGPKPGEMVGEATAKYHTRCRQFMALYDELLQSPISRRGVEHISDVYALEKRLLEAVAGKNGFSLPITVDAQAFERNHVQRLLQQFVPQAANAAQRDGNSISRAA